MTDSVKRAQHVMLEILLEFDRLCKKHGLAYWLDHGTLLGAVRHRGFIPWDDDLDVSMPREDYEKFLAIAKEELPEGVFLQHKGSDPTVPIHYAKLRDRGSTYIDAWEADRNIHYHQGIFIDIFPVNYIRQEKTPLYKRLVMLAKLFSNRYLRIDMLAKPLIAWLNRFHHPKHPFVVSGGEMMHYVIHIDKKEILPLKQIKFEGHLFPAPHNTERYLKQIFGDDYMTLPPKEKRKVHSIAIYPDRPCAYEKRLQDAE